MLSSHIFRVSSVAALGRIIQCGAAPEGKAFSGGDGGAESCSSDARALRACVGLSARSPRREGRAAEVG